MNRHSIGLLRKAAMWVPPIVSFSSIRLNGRRMKWDPTSFGRARRAALVLLSSCVLALSAIVSPAFTTAHFLPVQNAVASDIATLAALENPTRAERAQLRSLNRASNALTKTSFADGKMLRSLNTILGRKENYAPALSIIASNLLLGFNAEYDFVSDLLVELPESPEATAVKAQFQKFGMTAAKVNAAKRIGRFTVLYDAGKRKLDALLIRANQASLVPFPTDLPSDSVEARINGIRLFANAGDATDNVFLAVATDTNVTVSLAALLNSGGFPRGIRFSVPNAQLGTARYEIPSAATFTNRTDVYSPSETNVAATEGSIFISVNASVTELYGTFSCSGPDFTITDGRFRITISSQP
jgi:hypothetical protein